MCAGMMASCGSQKAKTTENGLDISTIISKYNIADSVKQVLYVNCTGGSDGHLWLVEKDATGEWAVKRDAQCYIGKNGTGKTKEGDGKTPLGVFQVRTAFGIKDNPGTKLDYVKITDDIYCCGCEKFYNQLISATATGHKCDAGEHMIKYTREYNYGMFIDYNKDNVFGLGSAIFVHCTGASKHTAGCVAMPEADMKYVLEQAQPGILVVINKD